MFPWGALIGAGASLAGGLINSEANDVASGRSQDVANNNAALQMRMAMHGVTMRARDVMNAYGETGLHPLALLGVNAPTYTPVNYVGGGNNAIGDAVSSAGQGIGRALDATASQTERLTHASRLDGLVTERAGLENDLLRMRIASEMAQLKQVQSRPAMPIGGRFLVDGQGEAVGGKTLVVDSPMKRTVADPVSPSQEPGAITDVGYARTKTGWAPVPSKDVKERIEDMMLPSWNWFLRNNLLPSVGSNESPPFKAPAGHYWQFNPWVQEYRLKKHRPHIGYEGPIRFQQ